MNEYNIAVQAFALQGTVNDQMQWMDAIKKAQVFPSLFVHIWYIIHYQEVQWPVLELSCEAKGSQVLKP